jgi:hypothetical protein
LQLLDQKQILLCARNTFRTQLYDKYYTDEKRRAISPLGYKEISAGKPPLHPLACAVNMRNSSALHKVQYTMQLLLKKYDCQMKASGVTTKFYPMKVANMF